MVNPLLSYMKKNLQYETPQLQTFYMVSETPLASSITDTEGADGLGAGGNEGTGEAGIEFGNAKERENEWDTGLW